MVEMLRRQRTILNILSSAGRPVYATQMQKYLFLLKKETFLGGDSAFYDFVPYRYGPYSFSAHREIESLAVNGYIESHSTTAGISLTATSIGKKEAKRSDSDTTRSAHFIISKYGNVSTRGLMKDVYARYSWFSINSELTNLIPTNAPRAKTAPVAVYTIGYEKRSIDGFLNRLLEIGVHNIIDTRANPISRKYGFARSSLSGIASKLGLEYSHFPGLGIPSVKRNMLKTDAELRKLFRYYESKILPAHKGEIKSVATQMRATPSVLVCMEKEAVDCHRSRLASHIAEMSGMQIVHL
ncbi:MAG TPA: DUF488 domain-containing protein [Terracidiphilus sp.]|jgi:uncharacterized protein YwgA